MSDRVISSPDVLCGKPRIAGTRISVELILEDLAAGMTAAEIAESYDGISEQDVAAAIRFAIQRLSSVAAE